MSTDDKVSTVVLALIALAGIVALAQLPFVPGVG